MNTHHHDPSDPYSVQPEQGTPTSAPSTAGPSWLTARQRPRVSAPINIPVSADDAPDDAPSPFLGEDRAAEDAAQHADGGHDWVAGLLEGLTPPQREAVMHTEGPLLVLAAAGSGKTRVITRRIAYLIGNGVPAWSILALTFTNKAAGEMRERVFHLLGGHEDRRTRGLTVTTFHSLCARLLRKYAVHAGLKEDFTIYDSSDQATLVKKVIISAQLSTANFPPRSVLAAISHAKNQLLDANAYAAQAHDFSTRNVAKVYAGYAKALRAANAVDFDDLLLLTAKLLREKADVRRELQDRWQYMLVDEYQDTNRAQFEIASLIAGGQAATAGSAARQPNFCVVGDPDQAIYAWRGADITNILDFERQYAGCRTITLGENFRSDAPILKAADTLIRVNKRRKHKDLFTSRTGGKSIRATLCREERHEAQRVVEWMQLVKEEAGLSWKDFAVFYRTNSLSRVLEEAFRGGNIPYTIARGTAFYEREEVKNAIAYLRAVSNHADDISFERIVNTPARGISDATVDKIQLEATRHGTTMLGAMRMAGEAWGLNGRALGSIQKFVQQIDSWSGATAPTHLTSQHPTTLADLVDRVIKESGLEAMYHKQAAQSQNESDEHRLDNLAELVSSARQFELEFDPGEEQPAAVGPLAILRAFLESVSLVADADSIDPASGSVTLMTLHAAKGLEFPAVAMVGMEEGLLPHARALTAATDNEMEEERRLCFVGMTRAMKRLMMTAAKYRTVRGISERTIPSRFLSEIGAGNLTVSDESDTFGDHAETEWSDQPRPRLGGPTSAPPPQPRLSGLAAQFPPGCAVRHPQFGPGTIRSVTPGPQARAEVEFRDVGRKTLVLEYARLTRV
ncbi:MAG TPA: UvrD-helicase domain-containing protein [Phycisphaerales bacterium]|nr:UvrD-helicase domain-containing protein [Phycisphaerales bacterium]